MLSAVNRFLLAACIGLLACLFICFYRPPDWIVITIVIPVAAFIIYSGELMLARNKNKSVFRKKSGGFKMPADSVKKEEHIKDEWEGKYD